MKLKHVAIIPDGNRRWAKKNKLASFIGHERGVNIDRLDKGCLIFNLEKENGYKVCIVDSNKSNDTQYWKDEFLSIKPASDNFILQKTFFL